MSKGIRVPVEVPFKGQAGKCDCLFFCIKKERFGTIPAEILHHSHGIIQRTQKRWYF